MIHLRPPTWEAICRHAEDTFPEECCGAILVGASGEETRRITNVQNIMHERDPKTYPRNATTAYLWHPRESLALLGEVESGKVRLKAFYHSHPDHDAYFSPEDKTVAMGGDKEKPSYPDVAHLVISIYGRQVQAIKAYVWDEQAKDFVETELSTDV